MNENQQLGCAPLPLFDTLALRSRFHPSHSHHFPFKMQGSDEDDPNNAATTHDFANIWDDERGGRVDEGDDMNLDDMDNPIETI